MKRTVFVAEDDPALQQLYIYSLENDFDCRVFGDGESLMDALPSGAPDLIILDVMLPGADGFELLSRIKSEKETSQIPVIMVSVKGDEISKVRGLNSGADDYLSKPFGVLELVARIRANLRKNSVSGDEKIIYKNVTIDFSKHQVTVGNTPVQTTLKEYNLLALLCENADKVLKRETIFEEVWGDGFIGETRTLDIHIKELRKKLAEAGSEAVIKTIRGVGYMLA